MDHVVLVQSRRREDKTERRPKEAADQVDPIHRAPRVSQWIKKLIATAVTMKMATATALPADRVEQPVRP